MNLMHVGSEGKLPRTRPAGGRRAAWRSVRAMRRSLRASAAV